MKTADGFDSLINNTEINDDENDNIIIILIFLLSSTFSGVW